MDVFALIYKIIEIDNIKILFPQKVITGKEENNIIKSDQAEIKHISITDSDLCYYESMPVETTKNLECTEEELQEALIKIASSKVLFIENNEIKELETTEFEEKYNLRLDYVNNQIYRIEKKTIKEIVKSLEKKILFQNNVIERIVTIILNNQYVENKKNIVLIGKKGVGKSKIIDLLAQELQAPYAKIEKYDGQGLQEAYLTLLLTSDDEALMGSPIIFIDGINRGIEKINKIDGDILIEIISDIVRKKTKIPVQLSNEQQVLFDLTGINYIIALDFEKDIDLPHIMGIGKNEVSERNKTIKKIRELLVDSNCEIIDMNELTEENLKTILEKSEISPVNEYKKILETQNTKLKVSKRAYELIAHEAYKLNKGAKGLNIISDYVMRDDIIDAQVNGKEQIIIDEPKVLKKTMISNFSEKLY